MVRGPAELKLTLKTVNQKTLNRQVNAFVSPRLTEPVTSTLISI